MSEERSGLRPWRLTQLPKNIASLRKDLDMFHVNHSSQFPDLEGLTKHLELAFFLV
jgi:hypothetical protein